MLAKQAAGERAVHYVQDGMVLGLGTGSTVQFALEKLAEKIKQGLKVVGIPTSKRTESIAAFLGIPLISFDEVNEIDLTIDGADEINKSFAMIKGGGGALLREKIVASRSKQIVIVIDKDKLVEKLGEKFLLPIEVLAFAWKPVSRSLGKLGAATHLRKTEQGEIYITDNGNYIVDADFGAIENPESLEQEIDSIPGVLESGLFINLATRVIVGYPDGKVEILEAR